MHPLLLVLIFTLFIIAMLSIAIRESHIKKIPNTIGLLSTFLAVVIILFAVTLTEYLEYL